MPYKDKDKERERCRIKARKYYQQKKNDPDWYSEKIERTKINQEQIRKRNKQLALERLGGKCCKCGTTDNLEFDHINPEDKVKKVSTILAYSLDRIYEEVDKCQLLCTSCHKEKTLENGDHKHK